MEDSTKRKPNRIQSNKNKMDRCEKTILCKSYPNCKAAGCPLAHGLDDLRTTTLPSEGRGQFVHFLCIFMKTLFSNNLNGELMGTDVAQKITHDFSPNVYLYLGVSDFSELMQRPLKRKFITTMKGKELWIRLIPPSTTEADKSQHQPAPSGKRTQKKTNANESEPLTDQVLALMRTTLNSYNGPLRRDTFFRPFGKGVGKELVSRLGVRPKELLHMKPFSEEFQIIKLDGVEFIQRTPSPAPAAPLNSPSQSSDSTSSPAHSSSRSFTSSLSEVEEKLVSALNLLCQEHKRNPLPFVTVGSAIAKLGVNYRSIFNVDRLEDLFRLSPFSEMFDVKPLKIGQHSTYRLLQKRTAYKKRLSEILEFRQLCATRLQAVTDDLFTSEDTLFSSPLHFLVFLAPASKELILFQVAETLRGELYPGAGLGKFTEFQKLQREYGTTIVHVELPNTLQHQLRLFIEEYDVLLSALRFYVAAVEFGIADNWKASLPFALHALQLVQSSSMSQESNKILEKLKREFLDFARIAVLRISTECAVEIVKGASSNCDTALWLAQVAVDSLKEDVVISMLIEDWEHVHSAIKKSPAAAVDPWTTHELATTEQILKIYREKCSSAAIPKPNPPKHSDTPLYLRYRKCKQESAGKWERIRTSIAEASARATKPVSKDASPPASVVLPQPAATAVSSNTSLLLLSNTQTVTTLSGCKHARQILGSYEKIAVDCQGVNLTRDDGTLSVIQFVTPDDHIFVVDVCAVTSTGAEDRSQFIELLRSILESEKQVKIMHDCRPAGAAILQQLGVRLKNVRDTQVLYAMLLSVEQVWKKACGLLDKEKASLNANTRPVSLKKLLEMSDLPIDAKSDVIRAKMAGNAQYWAQRPLTDEMIEYASGDVTKLFAVDDWLQTQIADAMIQSAERLSAIHSGWLAVSKSEGSSAEFPHWIEELARSVA